MCKSPSILFLLAIISLLFPGGLSARVDPADPELLLAGAVKETVILDADRTLYSVDECIHFRAFYLTDKQLGDLCWSSVLYIELAGSDGHSWVRSKFRLSDSGASGMIRFPQHLPSGVYYLKAYTRWMRNSSPERYACYPLKLINPYEPGLAGRHDTSAAGGPFPVTGTTGDAGVPIQADKPAYITRDTVSLRLSSGEAAGDEYFYSISVALSGLKDLAPLPAAVDSGGASTGKEAVYFPEISGISLSGKVAGQASKHGEENALVSLSLPGDMPFYSEMKTNEKGEFLFILPYSENTRDLYLNAEKDGMKLDIRIDNDFCSRPALPVLPVFSLSEQEEALAAAMLVNAQLTKKYSMSGIAVKEPVMDTMKTGFYGPPDKTYYTKDYIDLPEVREFIFELIPELQVTMLNSGPVIRSAGFNVFHNYPFLLLLDNIPVTDVAAFLAVRTSNLERLDVVHNSYVVGEARFNGILSAYSKKQDLAGIDLPENGIFIKYQMFAPAESTTTVSAADPRLPDRNMMLYWNPDLQFNGNKEAYCSFSASDIPGEYTITVCRISKEDGSRSISRTVIVVEQEP